MTRTVASVLTILPTPTVSPAIAQAQVQDKVMVTPPLEVTPTDLALLQDNNRRMEADQKLVDRVMHKLGLEPFVPIMPRYHPMIANSVLALLNQLDYTEVARKLDAPMPPRPDLETGDRLSNNRFLHFYNNQILRSIASKMTPGPTFPAVDLETGSPAEQDHRLIVQNEELLAAIARKLGVPNDAERLLPPEPALRPTEGADKLIVMSALEVAREDFAVLEDNNRTLDADQKLLDRIMHKLGLEPFVPTLPKLNPVIGASVLSLLNQLDYTEVARKVGVPLPPRPDLETGGRMVNDRFLHVYNNQILRSIAAKLEIGPALAEVDLQSDSLARQDQRLVRQNEALLTAIAGKLGVGSGTED